jgi:hypothetical protein
LEEGDFRTGPFVRRITARSAGVAGGLVGGASLLELGPP